MYELLPTGLIRRIADEAIIPSDPANRDYADYRTWVEDGNSPTVPLDLDETDQTWS
jgi:hypothetical protein